MKIISFVSEFKDKKKSSKLANLILHNKNSFKRLSLPYFNNFSSIDSKYKDIFFGDKIKKNDFHHYRFGFTGLTQSKISFFVAGYNFIYEVSKKNFTLKKILTNKLMCDLHGIKFYKDKLYFVLTGLDTLVEMNLNGKILNTFTILKNLKVIRNSKKLKKEDWRFLTKLIRGPAGYFHINYINVFKKNIFYLTSRNLNSIIALDIKKLKTELKTFHANERVMIHDGKFHKDSIYFTSVNGKILKCSNNNKLIRLNSRKDENLISKNIFKKFHYGLSTEVIDLKKHLSREPSWCRGICLDKNYIFTLIDGRRNAKNNHMKLIRLNKKNLKAKIIFELNRSKIKNIHELLNTTGFDIIEI